MAKIAEKPCRSKKSRPDRTLVYRPSRSQSGTFPRGAAALHLGGSVMKQFLTVVAVGVLGAFLLIACGGDKKPAETGGAGAGSAAPTESAAPAASPAAS